MCRTKNRLELKREGIGCNIYILRKYQYYTGMKMEEDQGEYI